MEWGNKKPGWVGDGGREEDLVLPSPTTDFQDRLDVTESFFSRKQGLVNFPHAKCIPKSSFMSLSIWKEFVLGLCPCFSPRNLGPVVYQALWRETRLSRCAPAQAKPVDLEAPA
jgi:hypothetical protein